MMYNIECACVRGRAPQALYLYNVRFLFFLKNKIRHTTRLVNAFSRKADGLYYNGIPILPGNTILYMYISDAGD